MLQRFWRLQPKIGVNDNAQPLATRSKPNEFQFTVGTPNKTTRSAVGRISPRTGRDQS